jgi:F-type H+-transporting ATPase subunit b
MSEILNILSSVGFNWHVALANFFNFLIILFLLNKFFFKKIGKTIQERGEIIERGLSKASEGEKLLASAEEERAAIIGDAKKESHSLLEKAKGDGDTIVSTMKEGAQKEISSKEDLLKKREDEMSEKVEKDFLEKAPAIVASLYKVTLKKEMTEAENNAFIARIK